MKRLNSSYTLQDEYLGYGGRASSDNAVERTRCPLVSTYSLQTSYLSQTLWAVSLNDSPKS